MFPYTPVIEHMCLGSRSQMQIQVKRTGPPQEWYSLSLEDGIFFQIAPWEHVRKLIFYLVVVYVCACVPCFFEGGKGVCKGKWRESGCSGFIGVGHELRLGYMVR